MADFCRFCGASVPHREGEGRCPRCEHHATLFYRAECDRLRKDKDRAYMRLQCADVPRDPWHWEVGKMLGAPDEPNVTYPHRS